jgi:CheY-like chemotaxis protein
VQDNAMTRILVVDDDKEQVRLLGRMLQGHGWEVDSAYDGASALAKVKSEHFDVVLMDIRMPEQDGLSMLQPMQEQDPTLTVILLSGDVEQGDVLKAFRSGAYECLLKPVDESALVKAVQQAAARPKPTWSRTAPTPEPEVKPTTVDPKRKTKFF